MKESNDTNVKVIVVDDYVDTLKTTVMLLKKACQCDVQGYSDSKLALQMIEEFRPHLLLLDIVMPRPDGFAIVENLTSAEMMPPLVVAVSGHAGEAIVARCLKAGFHRHVRKPVQLDQLQELVAEARECVMPATLTEFS